MNQSQLDITPGGKPLIIWYARYFGNYLFLKQTNCHLRSKGEDISHLLMGTVWHKVNEQTNERTNERKKQRSKVYNWWRSPIGCINGLQWNVNCPTMNSWKHVVKRIIINYKVSCFSCSSISMLRMVVTTMMMMMIGDCWLAFVMLMLLPIPNHQMTPNFTAISQLLAMVKYLLLFSALETIPSTLTTTKYKNYSIGNNIFRYSHFLVKSKPIHKWANKLNKWRKSNGWIIEKN